MRTSRTILVLLALLLAVLPSADAIRTSSAVVHDHSGGGSGGGTLALSGTLSSTKACATGYTRVTPNYCRVNDFQSGGDFAWTDATACTARTAGVSALPADAKAVLLRVPWLALANNAIANRANQVFFHNAVGCAASADTDFVVASIREWNVTGAGTVIGEGEFFVIAPLPTVNTFYTTQLNAGGNGNVDIGSHSVTGYLD